MPLWEQGDTWGERVLFNIHAHTHCGVLNLASWCIWSGVGLKILEENWDVWPLKVVLSGTVFAPKSSMRSMFFYGFWIIPLTSAKAAAAAEKNFLLVLDFFWWVPPSRILCIGVELDFSLWPLLFSNYGGFCTPPDSLFHSSLSLSFPLCWMEFNSTSCWLN